MTAARHNHELPPKDGKPIHVNVDTAMAGIGGCGAGTAAVWATAKQYYIDPCSGPWTYAIRLGPLAGHEAARCAEIGLAT